MRVPANGGGYAGRRIIIPICGLDAAAIAAILSFIFCFCFFFVSIAVGDRMKISQSVFDAVSRLLRTR